MPLTDEDAALQAIATLNILSEEQKAAQASIQRILHGKGADPFVNIHELFGHYNILYFRSLLLPRVEVSWSTRLTLCAGICELTKDKEGKYRRTHVKLSEPLLKFRPREDTIDTLLHEAIHAYFFITTSWRHFRGDDGTGHGAGFQLLADAINNHGAYNITIYHTFHDEVDSYRTHVWQCDGPCREREPFFGLVKRSMNRAPGKSDTWWRKHEEECGGTYTKISEPELTKEQIRALSSKARAGKQKNKLDSWVKKKGGDERSPKTASLLDGSKKTVLKEVGEVSPLVSKGNSSMKRQQDEPKSVVIEIVEVSLPVAHTNESLKRRLSEPEDDVQVVRKRALVECPICNFVMTEQDINEHLDMLHPP
ncbi:hypothetical protein K432DRAFT_376728 [Lepidopterella palustris CBS 459.81]|uniref:Protein with SprT-like domain at the N terminus n=1 Tax=Lepidopterella palustris CBS 459.81 TaxID=1314670 RepID=A0A8E2ELY7_9PEZI|nr:hypothetical protein K432DRAFT_376728 [Lepidopterella palustris CBS 459.81]